MRAHLRGHRAGVVFRRHLHHIAADHIEPLATAQDCLNLARGEAADFRRASAWRKGGVDAVNIEAHVDGCTIRGPYKQVTLALWVLRRFDCLLVQSLDERADELQRSDCPTNTCTMSIAP